MTETVEHNGVKLSVCSRNGLVTMIYGKKMVQIKITSSDVLKLLPEMLKIRDNL